MLTLHKNKSNFELVKQELLPQGESLAVFSCIKDGVKLLVLVKILPGGNYQVVGVKKAEDVNSNFSCTNETHILVGKKLEEVSVKPEKKTSFVESPFVPKNFLFWNSQKTRAPTFSF